jgi:hypothetical protein
VPTQGDSEGRRDTGWGGPSDTHAQELLVRMALPKGVTEHADILRAHPGPEGNTVLILSHPLI